jgi:hypothetical protein
VPAGRALAAGAAVGDEDAPEAADPAGAGGKSGGPDSTVGTAACAAGGVGPADPVGVRVSSSTAVGGAGARGGATTVGCSTAAGLRPARTRLPSTSSTSPAVNRPNSSALDGSGGLGGTWSGLVIDLVSAASFDDDFQTSIAPRGINRRLGLLRLSQPGRLGRSGWAATVTVLLQGDIRASLVTGTPARTVGGQSCWNIPIPR